jgi:hypothetical protein
LLKLVTVLYLIELALKFAKQKTHDIIIDTPS